jgi:hypothetical protein
MKKCYILWATDYMQKPCFISTREKIFHLFTKDYHPKLQVINSNSVTNTQLESKSKCNVTEKLTEVWSTWRTPVHIPINSLHMGPSSPQLFSIVNKTVFCILTENLMFFCLEIIKILDFSMLSIIYLANCCRRNTIQTTWRNKYCLLFRRPVFVINFDNGRSNFFAIRDKHSTAGRFSITSQ